MLSNRVRVTIRVKFRVAKTSDYKLWTAQGHRSYKAAPWRFICLVWIKKLNEIALLILWGLFIIIKYSAYRQAFDTQSLLGSPFYALILIVMSVPSL